MLNLFLRKGFARIKSRNTLGSQRKLGLRSDNPDLQMFRYNDNTIRKQKNVSCSSGNTRGRYDKRKNWVNTDNMPVPKRKAQR